MPLFSIGLGQANKSIPTACELEHSETELNREALVSQQRNENAGKDCKLQHCDAELQHVPLTGAPLFVKSVWGGHMPARACSSQYVARTRTGKATLGTARQTRASKERGLERENARKG